jgi:hypothetical protein
MKWIITVILLAIILVDGCIQQNQVNNSTLLPKTFANADGARLSYFDAENKRNVTISIGWPQFNDKYETLINYHYNYSSPFGTVEYFCEKFDQNKDVFDSIGRLMVSINIDERSLKEDFSGSFIYGNYQIGTIILEVSKSTEKGNYSTYLAKNQDNTFLGSSVLFGTQSRQIDFTPEVDLAAYNELVEEIKNISEICISEAQNCAQYDTGFIDCSKTSPYLIYPSKVPDSMAINKTGIENFISKNFKK